MVTIDWFKKQHGFKVKGIVKFWLLDTLLKTCDKILLYQTIAVLEILRAWSHRSLMCPHSL